MFCLELYDQTEIVCRCCSEKKHRRAQESWKMFADQHTRSMRPCNHWINSEPLIRSDWIRAAFGPPNKCCWQVTCMEWVAMLCQQGSMWCCEVSFEHSSNVFRNCANCWKLEHGSEINSWNVEKIRRLCAVVDIVCIQRRLSCHSIGQFVMRTKHYLFICSLTMSILKSNSVSLVQFLGFQCLNGFSRTSTLPACSKNPRKSPGTRLVLEVGQCLDACKNYLVLGSTLRSIHSVVVCNSCDWSLIRNCLKLLWRVQDEFKFYSWK